MTEEANEAEQPNEEAPKSQWLEPSPIGAQYVAHEQAMRLCRSVPIDKAFALAAGFNVGMLRRIAEGYKPKKIVVIEHGEAGFEVRRLGDNADTKLFYESISPGSTEVKQTKTKKDEICKVLRSMFEVTDEQLTKYDQLAVVAKNAGCASYSYISRRVSALAAFKNDEQGSTNAIKATLDELEGEGLIRKLSEDEAKELFGSSAVFYRVNRAAL
jgi:hypothetical protein